MIADEATGTVMDGTARFVSNHVLEVENAGQTERVEGNASLLILEQHRLSFRLRD